MSASLDIIYPSAVTLIRARTDYPVQLSVAGTDTLSYGTTSALGSTLAAGQTKLFFADVWIRTSANGAVLVRHYDDWQVNEEEDNFLRAGYNPVVDLERENPKTWGALDFVVVTNIGTGNRFHARSGNLTNVGDPPELVFRRAGPKGSEPYGPSGGGSNGEGDGTEIEGLQAGATIGFVGWQGFVPGTSDTGGSFQSFSVVNDASLTEDARQDTLTVTLDGAHDAEAETFSITGDMDAITLAVDGSVFEFHDTGTFTCQGRRIRYRGRSDTQLFGCTLESGDTGTLAAGSSVNQTHVGNGGDWSVKTALRTTNVRHDRFRAADQGEIGLGYAAISAGLSKFFTVSGGASHFKQLRKIEGLTASVVGTPGTTTITYKVIQRSPDGAKVDPAEVTITDAPDTLDTTNYVKLDWNGGVGTDRYDIVRSATDGSPATTGAIIRNQPWIRGPGAADTGLAPAGVNEVQNILFQRADGGTFTLIYDGETTADIDYPATASTIDAALEALSNIGAGQVAVTAGGETFNVEFTGTLAATNVSLIGADATNLTNADDPPHTPKITTRTTTAGLPTSYVTPTRNETGDVEIDGEVQVDQAIALVEQASSPPAPGATQGKLYAIADGSRTNLALRDSTGVKTLIDSNDTDVFIPHVLSNAKGDMIAATAADSFDRVGVGANTTVLTADSTISTGVKWADPQVNRYRQFLRISLTATAANLPGAAVYVPNSGGALTTQALSSNGQYLYIDSDDWAITGLTTKLRLVAACGVNDTAPAITLTIGLYPVANFTGGAGNVNPNFGTVVTGSTIPFASPAANSESVQTYTADFDLPSDGWYSLGVEASGAMAANSIVVMPTRIEIRNV